MNDSPMLVILPNLQAARAPGGRFVLTRKFLDGNLEYLKSWDGPLSVVMEEIPEATNNLDNIEVHPSELPFRLELVDYDQIGDSPCFRDGDLVFAGVGHRTNHLSRACRERGKRCVYITEYTLKTRLQGMNASTRNPLVRLRRSLWQYSQEREQRAAIALADGVQCNGTPTFEAYRDINPSPFLFFDTRVGEEMLAPERDRAARHARCLAGEPLRLVFSGRLIPMKGADHLVPVARELKRLGVPFELSICGGGEQQEEIRQAIDREGLGDSVRLLGVLDFKSELVPFVTREADLFVCCHRQGDPSCTYLETMSCGVPIAGYDNEAFEGIVATSGVGWSTPMDRPETLARKIAELHEDRPAIVEAGKRSLDFARQHTFEKTFGRRIEHLKGIVSGVPAVEAAQGSR